MILVALVYILEALSVMIQVTYFKYTKKKYGEGRRIFQDDADPPSLRDERIQRI